MPQSRQMNELCRKTICLYKKTVVKFAEYEECNNGAMYQNE